MSEEHEEPDHEHVHPFPMIQFSVGPSLEELENMRLNAMANAHEMHHFLDDLGEEELKKLINLIKVVTGNESAGFYYIGLLSHRLHTRFGVCMACGNKHDEELAEMMGDISAFEDPGDESPVKGTKRYDELMYLYGMEQDDDGSNRVMCKNCQTWYESLADRMLRPPGVKGCSNCQEKAKWG